MFDIGVIFFEDAICWQKAAKSLTSDSRKIGCQAFRNGVILMARANV